MKTVPWFVLKTFDGSAMKMPSGDPATMREVLLLNLGGAQIKDGKKAITAYVIGKRVYDLKENESLVLEDEEFKVLKEAIESNPPQTAVIWGQIWKVLSEADAVSTPPK